MNAIKILPNGDTMKIFLGGLHWDVISAALGNPPRIDFARVKMLPKFISDDQLNEAERPYIVLYGSRKEDNQLKNANHTASFLAFTHVQKGPSVFGEALVLRADTVDRGISFLPLTENEIKSITTECIFIKKGLEETNRESNKTEQMAKEVFGALGSILGDILKPKDYDEDGHSDSTR